ncbi:tyrosinase family protein [Neomegalonema perideroedes]|uniref:tyrosinase family protein n=1 Tax=Neomegalonema perideroedes TaxID=217219 RepID=UPI0003A4CB16|nr:tyrosinase family protein [Neomegalonema perideroedes]
MTRNARFRPTRRAALLLAGAALAAPAVQKLALAQPAGPPVRRSAHELSERDQVVQSLRRGVQAMRALDAGMPQGLPHPGGWRQGALYHAQICGPSARLNAGRRDPENEVHGGWWFLPWHRAYLAAMELRLREASGDPNLALPYWDMHANPTIPQIYQGDPASNPLAHAARAVGVFSREPLPFAGSSRQTERQAARSASFAEFAGGRPLRGVFAPGQLEMEAHNSAHAYVGGDMFDFATSGFDPLFYALHANIDRLWEVWRSQGGAGRVSPTDPVWGARRFAFQNQNGGMLQIATRDLEDSSRIAFVEFGLNGARNVPAAYRYDRTNFGAFGGVASAAGASSTRNFEYVLAVEGEATLGAAARVLTAPRREGASGGNGESALAAPASAGGGAVAPPAPPPVTANGSVDLLLTGVALPQKPGRLILEARRGAEGETFLLADRVLMPTLIGAAAEGARMSFSMEAGPGLMERNLRPADIQFLLRLESAEGDQSLSFEKIVLRYK